MSEQELEAQLDTGADDVETIETGDDEMPDDSQDDSSEKEKKNKSNWKKVSEKAKLLEKQLAEEKEARERAEAINKAWESENPDFIEKVLSKSSSTEKLEKKLFLIENPDAKEHLEKIDEIVAKSKGGYDRDEAWELIKDTIPKESVSKTDFTTKSAPVTNKKDVTKLSPDEALKLTGSDYDKWAKANGFA